MSHESTNPACGINSPSVPSASTKASLLELMIEADPLPHNADPQFHPLTGQRQVPLHLLQADYHLSPPIKPMGRIPVEVLIEMIAFEKYRHFHVFTFFPRLSAKFVVPGAVRSVAFHSDIVKAGRDALSLGMEALVWFMRARGTMKAQSWPREDTLSIFADPRSLAFAGRAGEMKPWDNVALTIPRPCTHYFGTPWTGVTLIVYEGEGDALRVWVQKRSSKVHRGGMLDSTAGGAVETDVSAWDGMAKEAEEEASLGQEVVRRYGTFEGAHTFYLDPESSPKPLIHCVGFLCFDLKRPDPSSSDYDDTEPRIRDDEVESFIPMSVPEILQGLQDRKFQPTAVPDLIFFLYRKGFINKQTEPDIDKVMARCQRVLDVATPHRLTDF